MAIRLSSKRRAVSLLLALMTHGGRLLTWVVMVAEVGNLGNLTGHVGISAGFFYDNVVTNGAVSNDGTVAADAVGIVLYSYDGSLENSGPILTTGADCAGTTTTLGALLGGIICNADEISISNM